MNIGKTISELRKSKTPKVTQARLAKSVGVDRCHINRIENGHERPSADILNRIAESLETPLPVIDFMAIEETDIPPEKVEFFRKLKPTIDKLIVDII